MRFNEKNFEMIEMCTEKNVRIVCLDGINRWANVCCFL